MDVTPKNQQRSIDDARKIGKMFICCNVEDNKKKELRSGPTFKKKNKKKVFLQLK